jgi:hypothetical protein
MAEISQNRSRRRCGSTALSGFIVGWLTGAVLYAAVAVTVGRSYWRGNTYKRCVDYLAEDLGYARKASIPEP